MNRILNKKSTMNLPIKLLENFKIIYSMSQKVTVRDFVQWTQKIHGIYQKEITSIR